MQADDRPAGSVDVVLAGLLAALVLGLLETVARVARGADPALDLGLLAWSAPAHVAAGLAVGLVLALLARLGLRWVGRGADSLPGWIAGQACLWTALLFGTRLVRRDGTAAFPDGRDGLELAGLVALAWIATRVLVPLGLRLGGGVLPARRGVALAVVLVLLGLSQVAPPLLATHVYEVDRRPLYAARLLGDVGPAVERRAQPGPPTAERPDVVLVTLDTTRADHLSTYGYERETSPRLTGLAQEGLRFDRAVAASSWTLPTHASMFTGLLPREHGARFARAAGAGGDAPPAPEAAPLDPVHVTLAELLRAEGYRTGAFVAGPYLSARYGVAQGFEVYDDRITVSAGHDLALVAWLGALLGDAVVDVADLALGYRRAEEVNDAVLAWLDEVGDERFFLFVNYFDAHGPLRPVASVRDLFPGSELPVRRAEVDRAYARAMSGGAPIEDDVRRWMVSQYDAELRYQDAALGRLFDRLERDGRLAEALVIVLADHGENLGEGGLIGHGFTLSEPVVHVPLVVRAPLGDGVPPGVRDELVHQVDVFATVLERLGLGAITLAPGGPAVSLLGPPRTDREAFSELHPDPYRYETFGERWRRRLFALSRGDHRLVETTPVAADGQALEDRTVRSLFGSIGRGPEGPELALPSVEADLARALAELLARTPEHAPSEWMLELGESAGAGEAALSAVGYAGD